MKKALAFMSQDTLQTFGVLLIIVSTILLVATARFGTGDNFGPFFFNYVISGGYLFAVLIHTFSKHRWRFSNGKIEHTVLLLVLWFVSAFALNRELNVFESSVAWLCVWIVLSAIVIVLASWYKSMPKQLNLFIYFLLGGALLLFAYYAVYLVPLYLISMVGLIAIGISMHTYIPIFLAIVSIALIRKASRQHKTTLYAAIAGFTLPVVFAVCYLVSWNSANNNINLLINQNTLNENKGPAWVYISQHMDKSALTERILKVGLVYHEVSNGNLFWGGFPTKTFDEPKQHDPLVVLATLFFKKPNLDETERINILKSLYNSRHQAQERLWSGDNLETISVISNVKLYPQYRMAYTEKTLTIRNNALSTWSQQEAIYTFHLAEGSVVSSLSLWINGHEEKSRLTTKAKADSAYHQIVGVENHDPSVVHWQEGNTITVRVFPCTVQENRKFKIGITSPLNKQHDELVYENPFFDGPNVTGALETIQVVNDYNESELKLPEAFKQLTSGVYRADKTYDPDWQVLCKAPTLAVAAFSFDDTTYEVKNYDKKYEDFTPDKIYLDLNNSWTKTDFDEVWANIRTRKVYVVADKLISLTAANKDKIFETMTQQNFSMFPLNEIDNTDRALLISKSTVASPNLNDLEGSDFAKELTAYLKTPKHIRFYNIGNNLTPYLKALKEFRVLYYDSGSPAELGALLSKHQFIKNQEIDQNMVIENAGLMIQKTAAVATQKAPDHLLRLFAYNDIMKRVGPDYFNHDYVRPDIIAEAEQAYIVSPVSSAMVLETQKDYERFGIDENKNSLKNASMKSSGAVPEPHEWFLFLLGLSVVAYMLYDKKRSNQTL